MKSVGSGGRPWDGTLGGWAYHDLYRLEAPPSTGQHSQPGRQVLASSVLRQILITIYGMKTSREEEDKKDWSRLKKKRTTYLKTA